MRKFFFLGWVLLLVAGVGCEKHYIQVTKAPITEESLASVFAKTPDPRQLSPPYGEELVVQWNLPVAARSKKLFLELTMIYRDYSEETLRCAIEDIRGVFSYFLLGADYEVKKGILTSKVDIVTEEGEILKQWHHRLWVSLIHKELEE